MTKDLFCFGDTELEKTPYAYTVCGLDNIFLLNGYRISYHDGEESVSVVDVDGLYRAIGRHLVMHRKALAPKEIRFLRKTLDLTQGELAAKLGNDSQSVARWEKGMFPIPSTAEKLFRATFLAGNITEQGDLEVLQKLLTSAMSDLDIMDDTGPAQAEFQLGNRWDQAQKLRVA